MTNRIGHCHVNYFVTFVSRLLALHAAENTCHRWCNGRRNVLHMHVCQSYLHTICVGASWSRYWTYALLFPINNFFILYIISSDQSPRSMLWHKYRNIQNNCNFLIFFFIFSHFKFILKILHLMSYSSSYNTLHVNDIHIWKIFQRSY